MSKIDERQQRIICDVLQRRHNVRRSSPFAEEKHCCCVPLCHQDSEEKEWDKIDWDSILPKNIKQAELPPEPQEIKNLDPRVCFSAIC